MHEFAEALKALPRHTYDKHEWDGEVCPCGECPDDADLECDGKDYHTR